MTIIKYYMILKYLKLTIKCYWIEGFVVIGSTISIFIIHKLNALKAVKTSCVDKILRNNNL